MGHYFGVSSGNPFSSHASQSGDTIRMRLGSRCRTSTVSSPSCLAVFKALWTVEGPVADLVAISSMRRSQIPPNPRASIEMIASAATWPFGNFETMSGGSSPLAASRLIGSVGSGRGPDAIPTLHRPAGLRMVARASRSPPSSAVTHTPLDTRGKSWLTREGPTPRSGGNRGQRHSQSPAFAVYTALAPNRFKDFWRPQIKRASDAPRSEGESDQLRDTVPTQ